MLNAYQTCVAHYNSKRGNHGLNAYFAFENIANKGSKPPCCCPHSESVQTDVLACFQMGSFGHLSVQKIWIRPYSSPETPSESYGIFVSWWLHLDAFLSRSGSGNFESTCTSQNHCRIASKSFNSETLLSRSGPGVFKSGDAIPKPSQTHIVLSFSWPDTRRDRSEVDREKRKRVEIYDC